MKGLLVNCMEWQSIVKRWPTTYNDSLLGNDQRTFQQEDNIEDDFISTESILLIMLVHNLELYVFL